MEEKEGENLGIRHRREKGGGHGGGGQRKGQEKHLYDGQIDSVVIRCNSNRPLRVCGGESVTAAHLLCFFVFFSPFICTFFLFFFSLRIAAAAFSLYPRLVFSSTGKT